MGNTLIEEVRKSAIRLGNCDPQWLKSGHEPPLETLEISDSGAAASSHSEMPHLMLLHGLFGALSNWEPVFPLMSRFARPIGLKFPLLTAHRSEVKVKAVAALTEYFIRKREIAPVAICGNSMGGHVALRLCLASPELVDCLILSGSSGLYEHTVDSLPIRPDERFVREHMARVFYDKKFVTDQTVEEVGSILRKPSYVLNLIHAARSAKRDNLRTVLKNIQVPTLLLWGEEDQVTPPDVAEMFHKHIPNSKLVTVKNCGHAPMMEQPEWFSAETEKFLRENSRFYTQKNS